MSDRIEMYVREQQFFCRECDANLTMGTHLGTCSHSAMRGGHYDGGHYGGPYADELFVYEIWRQEPSEGVEGCTALKVEAPKRFFPYLGFGRN